MRIKNGHRLRAQVEATERIVVRGLLDELDLRCGGTELSYSGDTPAAADPTGALEALAVRAGSRVLALGEHALSLRESKPLPVSV